MLRAIFYKLCLNFSNFHRVCMNYSRISLYCGWGFAASVVWPVLVSLSATRLRVDVVSVLGIHVGEALSSVKIEAYGTSRLGPTWVLEVSG